MSFSRRCAVLALASLLLGGSIAVEAFVSRAQPERYSVRKYKHTNHQVSTGTCTWANKPTAKFPRVFLNARSKDTEEEGPPPKGNSLPLQSFCFSLLVSLALVFSPLQQAHAGFGPSSGATTSPIPGLTRPRVQEQDLDTKKLKQLIGSSIDGRRLEAFDSQLDDVIAALKERKEIANEADQYIGEMDDDLNLAQDLQQQIQNREALLLKLESQPYWFNYLAAFIGSVASTLVMHPVDTIKTRLQIRSQTDEDDEEDDDDDVPVLPTSEALYKGQDNSVSRRTTRNDSAVVLEHGELAMEQEPAAAQSLAVLDRPETKFHSVESHEMELNPHSITANHNVKEFVVDAAKKEEGLFDNLYEGLTGNILKEGPPSALYLGVYESVKYSLVPKTSPEYLLLVYLLAGAAGETVGSVVRAPAESLKSLVQSKSADSALNAAKSILANPDEQRNVVRAWSSSIWRDVPFGAIQLAMFELIKAYILNNPNIDFDSSTLFAEAIIGAFAGGFGAFLTNPTDVITTRIIIQSTDMDDEGAQPLGVIGMGKKIYEEGGVGAFFTGWQARVGYWAPSISIFLTCYCSVRQAGVKFDFF